MKLGKKKIFIIIAIFCIITFLIALVNLTEKTETKTNSNEVEGWKLDTSPITFNWYINYSWFNTKWGNNLVSKNVTKKTGVSINFITPSGDESEKLDSMIDTGNLPDFITLSPFDDGYKNIIKNKLALPLNKLAEKYDTYFFKVADKQKLEWYKQPDGYVYCYPNYSVPISNSGDTTEVYPSNQTFLVRKDIYDALGKPDMRTPEGFLNALKEAKEKFPIINGQKLIPLGLHEFTDSGNLSLDSILPNFLDIPFEKNGQVYDRITDPEYIKWLKTFNDAYNLGLLSKEIFVDKRPQIEENISEGRYFAMLYQRTDIVNEQLMLYKNDKNSIYIPVDGPADSKLDPPKLAGDTISGWTVTLISKSCKDPMRAIRFLSYLISEEGNMDLYLGVKGVTWDTIDGKNELKPDIVNLLNEDRIAFDNKYGAADTYWMLLDESMIQKWRPKDPEPLEVLEDWPKGKTYNYSLYDKIYNNNDNLQDYIIYSQINDKWHSTEKNLLIAKNDTEFDAILNSFLQYRENEGYDKSVQYQQQKIEENKKKLGINN